MGLIYTRDELRDILVNLRDSKTVVCTCGCYEIFHIGHLECIEGAKSFGDVLIVGINSDRYIEENKKRTPIFNENDRCKVISSVKGVDYVFLFDELTFDDSLKELNPDYFVKGCDRTDVLEINTANALGVKIVHVGITKKASSKDLRKHFDC